MSGANFPQEIDSLGLVSGGVSYPEAGNINHLTSAMKAIETAFGENPLEARPGTVDENYTFQDTLLEQFAEFVRIECGEIQTTVRGIPLTDTSINSNASGQNSMNSAGFINTDGVYLSTVNADDFFSPGLPPKPPFGPTIKYRNPTMFTGGEDTRFFGWATVVTRMPDQQNWDTYRDSGGGQISGSLPAPYDYPTPCGISAIINSAGMAFWLNIGDSSSGDSGWNLGTEVSGGYPLAINIGQVVKIRYCAVEVGWLPS